MSSDCCVFCLFCFLSHRFRRIFVTLPEAALKLVHTSKAKAADNVKPSPPSSTQQQQAQAMQPTLSSSKQSSAVSSQGPSPQQPSKAGREAAKAAVASERKAEREEVVERFVEPEILFEYALPGVSSSYYGTFGEGVVTDHSVLIEVSSIIWCHSVLFSFACVVGAFSLRGQSHPESLT